MNNKILIGVVVGLVVGLVLGIALGGVIYQPSKTGSNNQVKLSGTITDTGIAEISFTNLAGNISSTAQIVNGVYSITLVGGQTYSVLLTDTASAEAASIANTGSYTPITSTLYIPSGVTTFTANF